MSQHSRLIDKAYIDWLQTSAAQAHVDFKQSLIPALIMLSVCLAVFVFGVLKWRLRYFSIFNIFLISGVLATFQACGLRSSVSVGGAASRATGPISPAMPPDASNIGSYLGGGGGGGGTTTPATDTSIPRIHVLDPSYNPKAKKVFPAGTTVNAVDRTNPMTYECQQYYAMLGINVYQIGNTKSCDFKNTEASVAQALTACNNNSSCSLVLDVRPDYYKTAVPTRIAVNSGDYFPVVLYAVNQNTQTVQIFDPSLITLSVVPNSNLEYYGHVEVASEASKGWFRALFRGFDSDKISTQVATIILNTAQADVTLNCNDDASKGAVTCPRAAITIRPEPYTAKMPEFNMTAIVTDNLQEPIRFNNPDPGFVNPMNGELRFTHLDLTTAPLSSVKNSLDLVRTYRSLYGVVGDFGYNWDAFRKRKYYSLDTQVGSGPKVYPFVNSGDGRMWYVPPVDPTTGLRDPGPFVDSTDPNAPNVENSRLFLGQSNEQFDLAGRLLYERDKLSRHRMFYLYEGSGLVLKYDAILQQSHMLYNLNSLLVANLKNARTPADITVGLKAVTSYSGLPMNKVMATKIPGNFVYFIRNDKGYVLAAVDKAGNFIYYVYDQAGLGDRLTEVWQYSLDTWRVGGIKLYSYSPYDTSSFTSDATKNTFRGLISQVSEIGKVAFDLSSIQYNSDPALFGEAPVVSAYYVGPVRHILNYDFKNQQSTQTDHAPGVSDRIKTFKFNDYGMITSYSAPTESKSSDLIYQALYQPRIHRILSAIIRKTKVINTFNSNGDLVSTETCADSSSPQLGQIQSDGTVPGCDTPTIPVQPASLKTVFGSSTTLTSGGVSYQDYFVDPQENLVPTVITMPAAQLPDTNGTPHSINRTVQTVTTGCTSLTGLVRTNGIKNDGVESCSWNNALLTMSAIESFEDGSLKKRLMLVPNSDGIPYSYGQYTQGVPYADTNQTGYYTFEPITPNDVYTPTGIVSRSANSSLNSMTKIFDPIGNVVVSVHPAGAVLQNRYFYAGPKNLLRNTKRVNMGLNNNLPNYNSVFRSPLLAYNAAYDGTNPNNATQLGAYKSEVQNAFQGASARSQILYQATYDDQTLHLINEFLPDGSEKTYDYYQDPLVKTIRVLKPQESLDTPTIVGSGQIADVFSNPVIATSIISYTYDALNRVQTITTTPGDGEDDLATVQTYTYRDTTDWGVDTVTTDSHKSGGVISLTKTMAFDDNGRPSEIGTQITGGTTKALPIQIKKLTRDGFGHVIKEQSITTADGSGNTGVITTKDSTGSVDPATGTAYKTSESTHSDISDISVDTNTYVSSLRGFDNFLQPQISRDEFHNKQVANYGVKDKSFLSISTGPSTYLGSDSTTLAYTQHNFDGCGNVVSEGQLVSGVWLLTTNQIVYDYGLCLKGFTTEPNGWTTYFGYSPAGEVVERSEYENMGGSTTNTPMDRSLRRTVLSTSFNTCDLDANGWCANPGYKYNMMIEGHPGLDSGNQYRGFMWEAAESAFMSNDIPIVSKRFIGDQVYLSRSKRITPLHTITGEIYTGQSLATPVEQLANLHSSDSVTDWQQNFTANSFGDVAEEDNYSDPVLGVSLEQRKYKTDPFIQGKINGSLERVTVDPLGRLTGKTQWQTLDSQVAVSLNSIASPLAATSNQLLSTMSVDPASWQNGRPTKITTVHAIDPGVAATGDHPPTNGAPGSATDTVVHQPNQEVNHISSFHHVFDQMANDGQLTQDFDGMNRLTHAHYSQTTGGQEQHAFQWDSDRQMHYDVASRVTSETLSLNDSIQGSACPKSDLITQSSTQCNPSTYQLGKSGATVPRTLMSSGNSSLSVSYQYPNLNSIVMNYGPLTVTYTLTNNKIYRVSVQSSAGTTAGSYSAFSSQDPSQDGTHPYSNHTDFEAGSLSNPQSYGWASWLFGLIPADQAVTLKNDGNASTYLWMMGTDSNGLPAKIDEPDPYVMGADLYFAKNRLDKVYVHPSGPNVQNVNGGGFLSGTSGYRNNMLYNAGTPVNGHYPKFGSYYQQDSWDYAHAVPTSAYDIFWPRSFSTPAFMPPNDEGSWAHDLSARQSQFSQNGLQNAGGNLLSCDGLVTYQKPLFGVDGEAVWPNWEYGISYDTPFRWQNYFRGYWDGWTPNLTLVDEKGRPRMIRKSVVQGQQLDAYDSSKVINAGDRAFRTEAIYGRGTSDNNIERLEELMEYSPSLGGAAQIANTQPAFAITRVVESARFNLSSPTDAIGNGARFLFLKEVSKDNRCTSASGCAGDPYYNDESSLLNYYNIPEFKQAIETYYVWGPLAGPLMAFKHFEDGTWMAFDFIYDGSGNLRTMMQSRPSGVSGPLVAPKWFNDYLPYLSSVRRSYWTSYYDGNDTTFTAKNNKFVVAGASTGSTTSGMAPDQDISKVGQIADYVYAPRILASLPNIRFGAQGFPIDINNVLENGYDPYTGSFISLTNIAPNQTCGTSSVIGNATQKVVNVLNKAPNGGYSPSPIMLNEMADQAESIRNVSVGWQWSIGRVLAAISTGGLSIPLGYALDEMATLKREQKFFSEHGQNWYFRNEIMGGGAAGWAAEKALNVASSVTCYDGWASASDAGDAVAFGESTAMCGLGFLGGVEAVVMGVAQQGAMEAVMSPLEDEE